jgi:hypothetical protein
MHPWFKSAVLLAAVSLAAATCGGDSPSGPSRICNITLSPPAADFGSSGGSGSVTVSAPAGCSWSATAGASWITITNGASGSGPGAVAYALSANTGIDRRSAALTIGDQTLMVRQEGRTAASCSYTLSRDREDFGPGSGLGSFDVSTAAECSWTATSASPWVVITGGGQGSGNGTVEYTVGANADVPGRDAVITVADRTYEVRQAGDVSGCEYSLTPVTFNVCMPNGTVQAALTTQASCPWTATTDASWIVLPGSESGNGSAVISMAYPANYDAPRDALVMVRWPTPTAGQNIRLAQAGCAYGVSATSLTFPSAGGSGTFDVLQQSIPTDCGGATQDRCLWTAQSTVPWIVITSSMPRAGDNPVAFSVAANDATQPRTGQITVRDRVVTITQAGH